MVVKIIDPMKGKHGPEVDYELIPIPKVEYAHLKTLQKADLELAELTDTGGLLGDDDISKMLEEFEPLVPFFDNEMDVAEQVFKISMTIPPHTLIGKMDYVSFELAEDPDELIASVADAMLESLRTPLLNYIKQSVASNLKGD